MSAVVHSIAGHPRLRISHLVELLVTRQRLAVLDRLREQLPLDDPDRHDLDLVDTACSRMTITRPDAVLIARQRRTELLRAVQTEGGRWKSGRAIRLYQRLGYGVVTQRSAAADLSQLQRAGLLHRHDAHGVTFYTLTRRGGRRA